MKKFTSALALAVMLASPAFAASKKTVKKKTTTTTTTTTTVSPGTTNDAPVTTTSSSPTYSGHSGTGPDWSANLGLGTIITRFHFGLGLKAQFPVNFEGNAMKFGAQTGFYIGPSSPTTWVIPFLITAEYDFHTANQLKPYLGLGIGIDIGHVSYEGGSTTGVDFSMLFTPGVKFGENARYYFEVPLGVIATEFAILPSIGMHF